MTIPAHLQSMLHGAVGVAQSLSDHTFHRFRLSAGARRVSRVSYTEATCYNLSGIGGLLEQYEVYAYQLGCPPLTLRSDAFFGHLYSFPERDDARCDVSSSGGRSHLSLLGFGPGCPCQSRRRRRYRFGGVEGGGMQAKAGPSTE